MVLAFFLQVYDVTPYVEEHPGGDAILNNAGRDSTAGFYGYAIFLEIVPGHFPVIVVFARSFYVK